MTSASFKLLFIFGLVVGMVLFNHTLMPLDQVSVSAKSPEIMSYYSQINQVKLSVDEFSSRNHQRLSQISHQCQVIGDKIKSTVTRWMFVLKERKLAWCPIFKGGTSKWLTLLFDLSSKSKVSRKL